MRSPFRVLTADRAVSPTIGIVLLVAIAVASSVAVGVLVFGFSAVGDSPQAEFDFQWRDDKGGPGGDFVEDGTGDSPDEIRITHTGGDSLDPDQLFVVATKKIQTDGGNPTPATRQSWRDLETESASVGGVPTGGTPDVVEQGDAVRVEPEDSSPEFEGETVRIVWEADSGGSTVVLATWTAPS